MIILAMGTLLAYNVVFFIYPLIYGFYGSFHDWNPLVKSMDFVGFKNYTQIFSSSIFIKAFINTVFFTMAVVILRTFFGLLFAVLLNAITKMKGFFRSIYFLPVVMPLVAVSIVWKWIYHPRIGLLNSILAVVGIDRINWLTDPLTAMPAVIFMTVWKDLGYAIVIFIAALLSISRDVYEAADLDGANSVQKFFKITVPLVKPTTIFIIITTFIGSFQSFIQMLIMTKGSGTTKVLSYLIFEEAFQNKKFGYASALSTILFLLIMLITFIQFKLMSGGEASD